MSVCLSVFSLWRKERARTTTWPTASWWPCWCSARPSWRGRGPSSSVRNCCWPSGRWSWRSWSLRSETWRTTSTLCWCESWSRSQRCYKCAPSSNENKTKKNSTDDWPCSSHVHSKTSTTALCLVTAMLSFLIQTFRHPEVSRWCFLAGMLAPQPSPRSVFSAAATGLSPVVLNVARPQVVVRLPEPGGGFQTQALPVWHPDLNPLSSLGASVVTKFSWSGNLKSLFITFFFFLVQLLTNCRISAGHFHGFQTDLLSLKAEDVCFLVCLESARTFLTTFWRLKLEGVVFVMRERISDVSDTRHQQVLGFIFINRLFIQPFYKRVGVHLKRLTPAFTALAQQQIVTDG